MDTGFRRGPRYRHDNSINFTLRVIPIHEPKRRTLTNKTQAIRYIPEYFLRWIAMNKKRVPQGHPG